MMSDQYKSRSEKRRQEQMKQTKKKHKKHPNKKVSFKKIFLTILVLGLIVAVGVGGLFAYYISKSPELDPEKLSIPSSSKVYDKDGELFADIGEEERVKVSYDDLPPVLVDAVLATEDVRFFDHFGIDLRRIGGAVIANVTDGFGAEGGSTITQQVIKGAFLYPDKTLERKVQEQWLAIQLDLSYSKETILEMYLNRIYYGSAGYGVATAAQNYFSVTDLNELSLAEAALLAGLPQRPSAYDPTVNPDLAKERMDTVLNLMVRHEKISEAEAEEAKQVAIEDMLNVSSASRTSHTDFLDQVQRELAEKYEIDLYNDGVKVYTTMDQAAQSYVEYLLSDDSPISYSDSELQSGLSVVETTSGAIRAIGGGRNRTVGGFNMAIQAKRQPGSSIKPIFSYGPAIEYLNYSTYEQMPDNGPYETTGSKPINNVGRYRGQVTLRTALEHSSNVVAAHLFDEVGRSQVTDFGQNLGLTIPEAGLNVRDAIGGSTFEASTLEMAAAYAAFGNGGLYTEPYSVVAIEYPDGRRIDVEPETTVAMSEATAYMVTDMMKDVVRSGTGTRANVSGVPVAGKTGTTDNNVDKWFVGLSTHYAIGAWTGYPDSSTKAVPDVYNSQLLFKYAMEELSKNVDVTDFTRPDSVVPVKVEAGTNPAQLPSEFTPNDQIITELFKRGTEPSAVSDAYEQLTPVGNLTATYDEATNSITVTWEHTIEADVDVAFEVSYQSGEPINTDATTFTIEEVEPETMYTINVTAFNPDKVTLTSETKKVEIMTPKEKEEEPDLPDIDLPDGENPNNNGNGNGNNSDPDDDASSDQPTDEDSIDEEPNQTDEESNTDQEDAA